MEEGLDLTAAAGETVTLHALAEDPDGDATTFRWYQYALADTYEEEMDEEKAPISIWVEQSGENGETAEFVVPEDAVSGDTIHMILEGIDEGGVNPIAYQRVIVTVQ